MVSQLDELKTEIDAMRIVYDKNSTKKSSLSEEMGELTESLKKLQKQAKKKKEVLVELEKLSGQDLRVL